MLPHQGKFPSPVGLGKPRVFERLFWMALFGGVCIGAGIVLVVVSVLGWPG